MHHFSDTFQYSGKIEQWVAPETGSYTILAQGKSINKYYQE
jgi:hypothetical protein